MPLVNMAKSKVCILTWIERQDLRRGTLLFSMLISKKPKVLFEKWMEKNFIKKN